MKEFENKIYRRLLAPVLACLVLALAGCSQDATEAEAPSSPTGGTYLTIVTRGINTTTPTEYEDYVKTLRVIAFKGSTLALNELLGVDDIPDTSGTVDEVELADVEKLKVGNGGGAYTFYFIANEEGHTTTENTNLSQALARITSETDLQNIKVNFTDKNTPMLMSTHQTEYIEEGVDKSITIKLVRTVAKINLNVINETHKEQTLTGISFSKMNVQTTSLIEGSELPSDGSDFTPYMNDITVSADSQIEDQMAYIFESSVTGNDVYTMSLNWNGKLYSENLSGVLGTEFKRNTELEINITLKQTYTPEFTVLVVAWTPIDVDVPAFE